MWKIKAPMKMIVFLWLVRHKRILCNSEHLRRGLARDDACPLCGAMGEIVEHVVRTCPRATEVWCRILGEGVVRQNEMVPLDTWIRRNIEDTDNPRPRDKGVTFTVTIWWIWQ